MNPAIVVNPYPVVKECIETDFSFLCLYLMNVACHTKITVNVVRDDLLLGGTKQRALVKLIESNLGFNEFVYAGPSSGFAQVALTISCLKLNKVVSFF
jgi:hypothetical protein